MTHSYDIMTLLSRTLCDKTNIIMIVDNPSNNFATTPLVETHLMTQYSPAKTGGPIQRYHLTDIPQFSNLKSLQ